MTISYCARCGKEGILFKRWVDDLGGKGNPATHELYVCPDSECQKKVDQKFAEMRQRKLDLKNRPSNFVARKN